MKRLLISSLGIFTLFGCASTVDVTTVPNSAEMQQVSNLQNILWNEVEVSSSFSFDISDKSQRLLSPTIDSTIAGFTFPYNGNPTQITLTSAIKNLSVFAPNLAIYDQNFKLIRTYSAKSFDYDRNDFIAGEVMEGEVVLSLDNQVTQVYALIYTTDTDLSDSTTIIHPAKAFAIAKRVDPPAIDDPIASHATTGVISISLEDLGGEYVERKRALYYGDKFPKADEKVAVTLDVDAQPETQAFYHSAIQKAVQDGNIPKALGLLEEAKALNIEGAQEVFVKAVNAQ